MMDGQWEVVKVMVVFTFGLALGAVGGVLMLAKGAPAYQVYWATGCLCAFSMFIGGLLLWLNGVDSDG